MSDGSLSAPSLSVPPLRSGVSGSLSPSTREVDVTRWARPYSVVISRNEEAATIATMVLLLVPRVVLRGTHGEDALPGASDLVHAIIATLITFVPATLIIGLWAARTKRSAGWITIDPGRRRVEWRRMKDRAGAATAEWSFDQVRRVEVVDAAGSPNFSALVVIEVPERDFRVRVPRGLGAAFAESFGRAIEDATEMQFGRGFGRR